jgi:Protein of unknown function (DUF3177)
MPSIPGLSNLVWADFRLAVLILVILPLVLLGWAAVKGSDTFQSLMIIYWRVSSLLAIAVYLLIGASPLGFLAGWLARLLIPASLWFWLDLNEEISEMSNSRLKLSVSAWRWAVTAYSLIGAVVTLPMLRCGFMNSQALVADATCQAWLQAPWLYREMLHPTTRPWFLGFLGIAGLAVYVLYFAYFVLVRLAKQGRSAMEL